jgi:hypothetical protein
MNKYKVQPGDTLGQIARKLYGDARRFPLIVAANAISNPDKLVVGQELIIPDAGVALGSLSSPPAPLTANPTSDSTTKSKLQILNVERLAGVHPGLAARGRAMIDLCAHAGIAILISQGIRTWEEQDALYAKGRTVAPVGKQFVVTNAKGGSSWHNFGLAFDIVVLDAIGKADWDTGHPAWAKSAEIGKSLIWEKVR